MSRSLLAWIVAAWRPHGLLAVPLTLLTMLNAVVVAALPFALKRVFDSLVADPRWETIRTAILVLAGLAALRFAVYCTLQNLRAYGNHLFEHALRTRLFARLLTLGPSFYARHSTGDTLTRLTNDIGPDMKLPWFLCSGIFRAMEATTTFVLVVAGCVAVSPPLTLACLVPLPLLGVLFVRVSRLVQERSARMQQAISAVGAELDCTFQGIRLVKAYGAEDERAGAFAAALEERRGAELAMVRAEAVLQAFHEYAWQLVVALILLVGGSRVIDGRMTLGDLMAFNAFAVSLTFPLFELGSFMSKLRQNAAIVARLAEIEETVPEVVDGPGAAAVPGAPAVELDEVHFAYRAGRPVLAGVGVAIRAGETLAVVGRVGAGKSTLLSLLVRLRDPGAGRVLRDGCALAGLDLDRARAGIGYVPQDPVILSETLRENVVFGRAGIDEATVRWALERSRFAQDLGAFPQGLDTPVGPRGTRLSGGQKQRLALARALAGRPGLLVMDDCTASLDAATEEAVWRDLARDLPGTTVVLVTHRVPVLARCDRILVLGPDGRAVQQGTHAELAARPGEYRELYRTGEVA